METVFSSEALVSTYKSTRRYNPEDKHRHLPEDGIKNKRRENTVGLQVYVHFLYLQYLNNKNCAKIKMYLSFW
jgi:hypothetical protein